MAEAAKALLDAGQEIPSELLGKVVKSLLLQVKRVDQQRRDSQQVKVCTRLPPHTRADAPG